MSFDTESAVGRQYRTLFKTLEAALMQAIEGKGKFRHVIGDEDFDSQPIMKIGRWTGTNHFQIGQAIKKAQESVRLAPAAARKELLGAIVYLAAAVALLPEAAMDPPLSDTFKRCGACCMRPATKRICDLPMNHEGRHRDGDYNWPQLFEELK
jgi:hypothetical protein